MSLSDAIKAEIERQGLTAYRVAKRAGIKPDVVSRFLSGERDILLGTADKITAALGMVLTRAGSCPPTDRASAGPTTRPSRSGPSATARAARRWRSGRRGSRTTPTSSGSSASTASPWTSATIATHSRPRCLGGSPRWTTDRQPRTPAAVETHPVRPKAVGDQARPRRREPASPPASGRSTPPATPLPCPGNATGPGRTVRHAPGPPHDRHDPQPFAGPGRESLLSRSGRRRFL